MGPAFFYQTKISPKEAPIRLIGPCSLLDQFLPPEELRKEVTSFHFPPTTFNRGFAVDVLWEVTKRKIIY